MKYAVPDDGGFCDVFIFTDKNSEVVPITVTVPRPLPTSMFFFGFVPPSLLAVYFGSS